MLLKPDAVGRGLNFKITQKFEDKKFSLVAARMQQVTQELAEAYYAPLKGTPAFALAVGRLLEGPSIATAWEAPGAIAAALALVGDADPLKADLSTIRGELAIDPACNLVECSADAKAAARELALWFAPRELMTGADRAAAADAAGKAGPSSAAATAADDASNPGGLSKSALKKLEKEAKKAEKKGGGKVAAAPAVDPDFYEPPSGTRDFFPEDMRVRNWLFEKFRETARKFAFQEYDAPVLEKVELYERKAGEEITDQMYNFVDKDQKRVTLRPEMTPTLARMVLSLGDRFLKPVKWYSVPQCWRFETVQRGRKREHFQWNMDIIGEQGISAEVELLAAVTQFFLSVGIGSADVGIKVNSRKVLTCITKQYGVPDEHFAKVAVIVDKLDKIGDAATIELLVNMEDKDSGVKCGLPLEAATKIVQSLSLKNIEDLRELTGEGGKEAVDELTTLFEIAKAYGYADWIFFDASVVRGLAYYTGIVFEGFDRKGELRAICGGGRYDRLYSDCYHSPSMVPAVGFGFGDCVIMELLRQKNLVPVLTPSIDFVVMAFNNDMRAGQVQCAALLRQAGYAVDVLLEPAKKVAKAFNYADRVNGRRSLFVAPDEWAAGKVRMKDLRSAAEATEREVDLNVATLVEELQKRGIMPSTKPFGLKE